jgi:hypothetical protein
VHALTGFAGVNVRLGERRHDYGVDGSMYNVRVGGGRHVDDGYPVDFQMKASTNWSIDGDDVIYDIEAKTYNDMVQRNADVSAVSLILFLLSLPKDSAHWLTVTENNMVLKNCCYWIKLSGAPTTNTSSTRIRIPRQNVLNHRGVVELLRREREGWPT